MALCSLHECSATELHVCILTVILAAVECIIEEDFLSAELSSVLSSSVTKHPTRSLRPSFPILNNNFHGHANT